MGDKNIKKIIGSQRYKLATNTNTIVSLNLESKQNLLRDNDIRDVINLEQLSQEERQRSLCFRESGRINILTTNDMFVSGTTLTPIATDEAWTFVFNEFDQKSPNNWVIQITYPVESDYEFIVKSRDDLGTTIKSSMVYRGLQFNGLSASTTSSTDLKVSLKIIQKHNLIQDDYVYLYNTNSSIHFPYQGLHQIESLGIDNSNTTHSFTLKTLYTDAYIGVGNMVKVINPSKEDMIFVNTLNFYKIQSSDVSGNTSVVTKKYLKIKSGNGVDVNIKHGLRKGDYIDVRYQPNGNSNNFINGIFIIESICDEYSFTIKIPEINPISYNTELTVPNNQIKYRRLDGTPSEYYVRKFEVLTENDYDVYKCAFSTNIYPNSRYNDLSISNDTWLFHFNKDVNLNNLRDNRNGYVHQLYTTFIKRAGRNPYGWSKVTADWDFNYKTINSIDMFIETISNFNANGVGDLEKSSKGDRYVGDFIEFNRLDLNEVIVAEIVHRFGYETQPTVKGYYYKPFKVFDVRVLSNNIEKSNPDDLVLDLPSSYIEYPDQTIVWKDLLDVGYFEDGTNGVDYPFSNGCHYLYKNYYLYIKNQETKTDVVDIVDTLDLPIILGSSNIIC